MILKVLQCTTMWSGIGNSKSQVLPSNSATWKWSGVETEVGLGVSFVTELIYYNITSLRLHFTYWQRSKAKILQAQDRIKIKMFLQQPLIPSWHIANTNTVAHN